ncbi:MAG: TIGR03086 family metal-binding protein [Acidimicrobiia bacterium]
MTDVQELFPRAVGEFDRRVEVIADSQWDDDTPCTEWSVRDLVNHLTYEDLWVPELLAGKTLEEVGDRFDGDILGDEPKQAWRRARDGALKAVSAGSMDRPVHTSMGEMPARDYLSQLLSDHLVHAWDLARAIGSDEGLDEELVRNCDAMMRPYEAMMRASGVFGDYVEVPADTDAEVRLLALFGRRV